MWEDGRQTSNFFLLPLYSLLAYSLFSILVPIFLASSTPLLLLNTTQKKIQFNLKHLKNCIPLLYNFFSHSFESFMAYTHKKMLLKSKPTRTLTLTLTFQLLSYLSKLTAIVQKVKKNSAITIWVDVVKFMFHSFILYRSHNTMQCNSQCNSQCNTYTLMMEHNWKCVLHTHSTQFTHNLIECTWIASLQTHNSTQCMMYTLHLNDGDLQTNCLLYTLFSCNKLSFTF